MRGKVRSDGYNKLITSGADVLLAAITFKFVTTYYISVPTIFRDKSPEARRELIRG